MPALLKADMRRNAGKPGFPGVKGDRKLVLHARPALSGAEVCADSTDGHAAGGNIYVPITSPDGVYMQKAWDALKREGDVHRELTPSFFARLYGWLRIGLA